MDPTRARLDALTGLRYLAAMSVLLAHMSHNLPWAGGAKYLATLSGLGMPLFFVLSGFLMAYNYSAGFRADYGRTLWGFYVARVARIYPVYLVTILLFFSFVGNFWHDLLNRPDDTLMSLGFVATLTQSWVHIPVFTDYMHARTVTQAYVGVAWSVSTEAFFYLVFPLVVLPVARLVRGLPSLLTAGGLVFAGYVAANVYVVGRYPDEQFGGEKFAMGEFRWLLYLSPYQRSGEFLIGALTGQYFLGTAARKPGPWWFGAGLLAGSAVALVWGNFWLNLPAYSPAADGAGWENALARTLSPTAAHPVWLMTLAGNVLYAPLCAVIIYQLAALPSLAGRALGCRLMVLLGEVSYSLYLLHPLAQSFFYLRAAGEGPLKDWYIVAYNNLAMLAALHFLCLGIYRYVEVPSRAAIRNWFGPRPRAALKVVPAGVPVRQAA
ncbi:MAG: acyltransferase [Gemmataceae bacterium]|nr:acyltransferase [Gemmataceae bacterium]